MVAPHGWVASKYILLGKGNESAPDALQWESYPWFSEFVGGVQDSSQDLKCVCIIKCLKIPMLLRSSSYNPHHRHHFLSRKNPGAPSLSEQTNEPFSRIHRPKGPERTAIQLQLPQIHSNPIVRRICFQNYLAANPGNPLDSFQTLDLWKSSEWGDMITWIFFHFEKDWRNHRYWEMETKHRSLYPLYPWKNFTSPRWRSKKTECPGHTSSSGRTPQSVPARNWSYAAKTSWWLNQPIWKIWVKMDHSPR